AGKAAGSAVLDSYFFPDLQISADNFSLISDLGCLYKPNKLMLKQRRRLNCRDLDRYPNQMQFKRTRRKP
ncbi:hypothetical protein LINPERHAP1_LOCUS29680, partial [Linum perenne]